MGRFNCFRVLSASGALLLLVLMPSKRAHADQCAWTTRAQSEKAAELLHKGKMVVDWCEPCGEKAPRAKQVYAVESVKVAHPEGDGFYWELSINGKPVDLAYEFVMVAPNEFKNLASLASCPATGVSAGFHLNVDEANARPETSQAYDPTASTFQEMENEAGRNLRAIFTAEKSLLQDKDRYSNSSNEIGFKPEACPNGSRPGTPGDDWTPGCNFIYRIELSADHKNFTARARGVSGELDGAERTISSEGSDPGKVLKVSKQPGR
jgi:hypothetical protein